MLYRTSMVPIAYMVTTFRNYSPKTLLKSLAVFLVVSLSAETNAARNVLYEASSCKDPRGDVNMDLEYDTRSKIATIVNVGGKMGKEGFPFYKVLNPLKITSVNSTNITAVKNLKEMVDLGPAERTDEDLKIGSQYIDIEFILYPQAELIAFRVLVNRDANQDKSLQKSIKAAAKAMNWRYRPPDSLLSADSLVCNSVVIKRDYDEETRELQREKERADAARRRKEEQERVEREKLEQARQLEEIRKKTEKGTDAAEENKSQLLYSSTGFYINTDGYILSNYTNASSCDEVRLNEQKLKVVAFNEATDLIVLASRYENSEYLFMSEEPPIAGTKVTNIGYDLAKTKSFTPLVRNGEIAEVMGSDFDYGKFQTDLDVMPGGSGAALIDSNGAVLGMATNDLREPNDLSRLHASKGPLITEVLAKADITFHYQSGFSFFRGNEREIVEEAMKSVVYLECWGVPNTDAKAKRLRELNAHTAENAAKAISIE